MATGGSEDEEELLSKGLYRLVSDIIGPEVEVKLRRERVKIMELMQNNRGHEFIALISGSFAEGFEMKTSDLDVTIWSRNTVVLDTYFQFIHYHQYFKTVLMVEYNYTAPRFVLVKCVTQYGSDHAVANSCVWAGNENWVSSKKFMEYHLQERPSASAHGPCQSGVIQGWEYDHAQCIKCAFWPKPATAAISRMIRSGWPPEAVIQEIINDGCLLVPVMSKKLLFEGASNLEWRISFSLAEKRLIHSMNHCQFLCYGLWKLFLNEVLKKLNGIEDMICSYFLKTVVFWEISRDPSSWTPTNFISKFHQTLRLLARCVSVGYCPHFFIPDHNIFYGKVFGEGQRKLMSYLRSFINEGFFCLLKCESLRGKFLPVVENPLVACDIPTDESIYISVSRIRALTLSFICHCQVFSNEIKESLYELFKLSSVNMDSEFSSIVLAIRKQRIHQNIAERSLHSIALSPAGNRTRHRYLSFINILRKNRTYLGYCELILAKSFYLLKEYSIAILFAGIVKSKLQNENIMYTWAITEEGVNMTQTHDRTYLQIIEQYVASSFEVDKDTTLHELFPEICACIEGIGVPVLYIPPLVMAFFLVILSHHKMNEVVQMHDVLRELYALVLHDDNFHIQFMHRAISWEILGLCQELCGDYSAAYISYIVALNERYNDFKAATLARINSLQLL